MNSRASILIVDDQPDNLLILEDLLAEQYRIHTAGDGEDALSFLADHDLPDLILLDVMMPRMNGYEVCERLKRDQATRHIPIIVLSSLESPTDEERALLLGAEDFIHKPFSPPVVLARVRNHLRLSRMATMLRVRNDNLEHLVAARTREIREQSAELMRREEQLIAAQGATITAFCSLAEARDNETGNHIRRTQNYVRTLAKRLKRDPDFTAELSDEAIELLFKSAPLHDIGKVAIPDAILLKPGRLTPAEWQIMKRHAEYGYAAIVSAEHELDDNRSFLRYAKEIAYGHHERWDGTGYPRGLAGDAIPLSARLMAVDQQSEGLPIARQHIQQQVTNRRIALRLERFESLQLLAIPQPQQHRRRSTPQGKPPPPNSAAKPSQARSPHSASLSWR